LVSDSALKWFKSCLSDLSEYFNLAANRSTAFPEECSVLQGLALGPTEFTANTERVVGIIKEHSLQHQLFAEDVQLYSSCALNDTVNLHHHLHRNHYSENVSMWCASLVISQKKPVLGTHAKL
jgi:Reverse transcriptase (RNA-dependent DNA polymerase)